QGFGSSAPPPGFTNADRKTDGADTFFSGEGSDVIDPASGNINSDRTTNPTVAEVSGLSDTLNISRLASDVSFDLDSPINNQFGSGNAIVAARPFDSYVGTPRNDTLQVDALTTARSVSGGPGRPEPGPIRAQRQPGTV